jgi:hypothetical protein
MTRNRRILLTVAVAVVVVAGVLFLLAGSPQPVQADPGTLCVAPGGSGCDPGTCGGMCYASVQGAVDAAAPGNEIRVATGTYTGVQARDSMTQVVYISKTVTLRGGYSGDLTVWNPDAYPTTLDAQRAGRVVSIVGGAAAPTLEGFIITGGDATGVTLNCPTFGGLSDGCGGGIFVRQAQPTIANNIVTHNVAGVSAGSHSADGGGLCLSYASGSVITGNLIISNTASLGESGAGGGIALSYPYGVVVASNQVLSNVATTHNTRVGAGGGIAIDGSGAVAAIQDNLIEGNRTNGAGTGYGAGIYHWYGSSHFEGNQVTGNYGTQAVYLGAYATARFESNQVLDNHTSVGIGVVYGSLSGPTLVNNVVARSGDKGILLSTYSAASLTATLIHNTLIGSGTGYGVSVESGYVALALTNTIVASHTWGITNTVPASSTVTADHTLFWANVQDGIAGTSPVYGDPAFVGVGDGYHVGPGSAAIDAGVATAESVDIDGDSRPLGAAPDIGADEALWWQVFLPLVLRNH